MKRLAALLTSTIAAAALLRTCPAHAANDTALRLVNTSGSNTSYVRIPNSPAFSLQTFTLEAWVQRVGNGYGMTLDGNGAGILVKGFEGAVGTHIVSWHLNYTHTGRVIFDLVHTFAGSGVYVLTPELADPLARHHLAATFDGAMVRVVVDGALAGSAAWTLGSVHYGADDVLIGATNFGAGFLRRFDGWIDDVRIWDHARTSEQIAASMNCRLSGSEPGLVAYWPFDGGDFADLTGHGHVGGAVPPAGPHTFGPLAALGSCLTGVEDDALRTSDDLALSVYPQPARDRFTVDFTLPTPGHAHVEILDVAGRRLAEYGASHYEAGRHSIAGSLRDLRSTAGARGVLFVRVSAAGRTAVRTLVAMR